MSVHASSSVPHRASQAASQASHPSAPHPSAPHASSVPHASGASHPASPAAAGGAMRRWDDLLSALETKRAMLAGHYQHAGFTGNEFKR